MLARLSRLAKVYHLAAIWTSFIGGATCALTATNIPILSWSGTLELSGQAAMAERPVKGPRRLYSHREAAWESEDRYVNSSAGALRDMPTVCWLLVPFARLCGR